MLLKQIIINTNCSETRLAVVEGNKVSELFIERHRDRGLVGNIYKGIVTRVLPGMQSAFIDIGEERSAFLYGGDVLDPKRISEKQKEFDVGDAHTSEHDGEEPSREATPIEHLLRENQDIVVQVAKDPLGSKGARVTMFLSLPGRYLVLMPDFNHIGVSRRISDEKERDRLRDILKAIKPDDIGLIVRTAAVGIPAEQLEKDLRYLTKVWKTVKGRTSAKSPAVLYHELDIILKITRDLYSDDIKKIVIDNKDAYERLKAFLTASIPGASQKLELYGKQNPIFDEYGIEIDIARSLSSKVWLPSGGYLVIDQTEALTSFDVNTGKFVGHHRVQDTILKTNMEAVKEIVSQLRIRNIGGIIVLDFIDMERSEDKELVYNSLQEELKADKARTTVLKISDLGLVQMTRKRTSESLERNLTDVCPYCDGRGRIHSTPTEAYNLLRDVERYALRTGAKNIKVKVRDDIRDWILDMEQKLVGEISERLAISIEFFDGEVRFADLSLPTYEVFS